MCFAGHRFSKDPSLSINLNGAQFRKMLYNAQSLPLELTRPEVAEILIKGGK